MYADDEKMYAFYQCSIGELSLRQRAIFLEAAGFCADPNHANEKNRQEMTKLCICCFGAIYVVESEKTFNHRLKYGYCKTKPETNPNLLQAPKRYKRLKNQPHFRDIKPHRREILEAMEGFEDIADEIRERFPVKGKGQISKSSTDEQEKSDNEKLIDADKAIKLFGRSRSTFYRRVDAGLIKTRITETKTYYLESSVIECREKNP
jgi:hypothetical protein